MNHCYARELSKSLTEFNEAVWVSMVEYVTVCDKDDFRFMLPCGVEVKA